MVGGKGLLEAFTLDEPEAQALEMRLP